jgi:hypothetical protein
MKSFGKQNLKKFWMTMNEQAQDLTDEILKKFQMAMNGAKRSDLTNKI